MKKKIILAGGSGFLGRPLAAALEERGYETITLTRTPRPGAANQVLWDGKIPSTWSEILEGAEAVVNLTGRSVNCRHNRENRREIIESRTGSVHAIAAAIARCHTPPKTWVQAGSLAIYGDAGNAWCDEATAPGNGFAAETCVLWERAFLDAVAPATRKVMLRISFALGHGGGALETLAGLTRAFLGGPVGTGRQFISWIHNADRLNMFIWAIERDDVSGIFNATGPDPVTNADFMRELRRALRRPWSPPVPAWLVRAGAWTLGTEPSLALTGRRGRPCRFEELGFEFQFPHIGPALEGLYWKKI